MGREVGGGFRMGGAHVYLRPINVDVWQKPSQYYKVIILQLKQINSFKKNPATRLTSLRPIIRKGNIKKEEIFLKREKEEGKNFLNCLTQLALAQASSLPICSQSGEEKAFG